MKLVIEELKQLPVFKQKIEIVERKGIGHPDYICDAIMERISAEICKEYLKRVGKILHYNLDKALLAAGESETRFGGGKIKKPMKLIIGDRATYSTEGMEFDIDKIVVKSAKDWFKHNFRFLDPEAHVKYEIELKHGSASLTSIFKEEKRILGANDTSASVGYAPLTPTEKIVLDLERFLNSKKFKREFPESGEDVKVMATRIGKELTLTIAMAFIDRLVPDERSYFKSKEEIEEKIREFVEENPNFEKFEIWLNALDRKGKGEEGVYLTVTGTSAEGGDSGQVGRGNRVNGVISLNRPSGNEAAAGKNPVSHVGKIYNLLTFKIAEEIYDKVAGLEEVYVWMVSRIGVPIDKPPLISVQTVLAENMELESVKKEIEEIVEDRVARINEFVEELIKKNVRVC